MNSISKIINITITTKGIDELPAEEGFESVVLVTVAVNLVGICSPVTRLST